MKKMKSVAGREANGAGARITRRPHAIRRNRRFARALSPVDAYDENIVHYFHHFEGKGCIASGAREIATARPAVTGKDFRVRRMLEHMAGGSRAALHRKDPFGGAETAVVARRWPKLAERQSPRTRSGNGRTVRPIAGSRILTDSDAKGSYLLPFVLKSVSMKFSEYIRSHHVFTVEDLLAASDSPAAAKQQLKEAAASGSVERVRRGLYASNSGRFEGAGVDPYEVVAALDAGAILSYHSALEAHGVAHNVGFECRFRTDAARSPFSFRSMRYVPHPAGADVLSQRLRGRAFGSVLVTTREQTLFDCLKHPEWAGGIEEAVRSLSAMPYLDAEKAADLALADSASMAARAGWLLAARSEAWRVPEGVIERLREASAGTVSKLNKRATATRGWSREWNMRLPESEEEVASWAR